MCLSVTHTALYMASVVETCGTAVRVHSFGDVAGRAHLKLSPHLLRLVRKVLLGIPLTIYGHAFVVFFTQLLMTVRVQ